MNAFWDDLAGAVNGALTGRVASPSGQTWENIYNPSTGQSGNLQTSAVPGIYPTSTSNGSTGTVVWTGPSGANYGVGGLYKFATLNGCQAGPVLRTSATGPSPYTDSGYIGQMDAIDSQYNIYSITGGGTVNLLASAPHTFTAGEQHYLYFSAVGTELTLYVDGTSVCSVSDSTYDYGSPGTRAYSSTAGTSTTGAQCYAIATDPQLAAWSGADSGAAGVASATITLTLEAPSTLGSTATLSDGGDGGTFSPTSLTWAAGSSSGMGATVAGFTYKAATAGTKTLTATISNTSGVSTTVTGGSLSFTASASAVGYTLTGPANGETGVASTNFTLTPASTVTSDSIALSDEGAGGTFSPAGPLVFTASSTAQTFTYTPGSVGAKTLALTSADGGVITGSPWSYTSESATAVGYAIGGATTSTSGVASASITVTPASTVTSDTVSYVSSDGSDAFSPASPLTFTSSAAAKDITLTAKSPAGVRTITFTSADGGVITGSPWTLTATAIGLTLTGPASGVTGVASTNFTVLPASTTTDSIALSDEGAGGAFTPASPLIFTAGAAAQTFTYTPASVGPKTLSLTSADGAAITGSPFTYTGEPGTIYAFWDDLAGAVNGALTGRVASPSGQTWVDPYNSSTGQSGALQTSTVPGIYPTSTSNGSTGTVVWTGPSGANYGVGGLYKFATLNGCQAGPVLRAAAAGPLPAYADYGYFGQMDAINSQYNIYYMYVGGTVGLLASTPHTFTAGEQHYLYFSAVGTELTLYVDGVSVCSVSDGTYSAAGQPGTRAYSSTAGSSSTGAQCYGIGTDPQLAAWGGAHSGAVGVASATITLTLEAPSTLGSTATLSDGGNGGTFTPTSLTWAAGSATGMGATVASFTYTAASPGTKTLTATISNTSGASTTVTGGALSFSAGTAVGYAIGGATTSTSGVASASISVTPASEVTSDTVSYVSSASGDTFTPASPLTWTDSSAAQNITITALSPSGARTVTFTSADGGIITGSPWTVTATAIGLTLTGPASGMQGIASAAFSLTPASSTIDTATITSSVVGDTITTSPVSWASPGSSAAKTFTVTPSTTGARTITVTTADGATVAGSPWTYTGTTNTAVGYAIGGATGGPAGVASANISVTPASTVTSDTVNYVSSAGGDTFDPTSPLTFTASSAPQDIKIVPASAGPRTITFTSSDGGIVTGSPWTYTVSASGYTLSGATTGTVGVASAAIDLTPNAIVTSDTVTPSDGGAGGTFTPSTLSWTASSAEQSFGYTGLTAGTPSLTFSSSAGLTVTGSPLRFTVSVPDTVSFDTYISGFQSGQATSAVVTPLLWSGSGLSILSNSEETIGTFALSTVTENTAYDPGGYTCRITLAAALLPTGTTLQAVWTVAGSSAFDPAPVSTAEVATSTGGGGGAGGTTLSAGTRSNTVLYETDRRDVVRITSLTATGSSQATAYPLPISPHLFAEFVTVVAGTGAVLFAPTRGAVRVVVQNSGLNALAVYPNPGGTINGGAVNAAYSLASGLSMELWVAGLYTWYLVQ
jgi:hypothetical protein